MLDASLRLAEGDIPSVGMRERGAWVRVEDIPVLQAEMAAELKTWGTYPAPSPGCGGARSHRSSAAGLG